MYALSNIVGDDELVGNARDVAEIEDLESMDEELLTEIVLLSLEIGSFVTRIEAESEGAKLGICGELDIEDRMEVSGFATEELSNLA